MAIETLVPNHEVQRSYSVLLDTAAYQDVHNQRHFLQPEQYRQVLATLNQLTETNLKTSLAERFNAELLSTDYEIEDQKLIHPTYNLPFSQIIARGQKCRQEAGSNDVEREMAEVIGFEKVEKIITSPNFSEDCTIVVISPRGKKGSIYQHNYYDIYQKQGTKVTMSRFSSKSSYSDFAKAAEQIDPFSDLASNPKDSDFISSPLITYKPLLEIHTIMQIDDETMALDQYQKLIEECLPLILDYIRYLQDPNLEEHEAMLKYNRIPKFADIVVGKDIQYITRTQRTAIIEEIRNPLTRSATANFLGTQDIRSVAAYCGLDGGYKTNNYGVQSVADFGLKLFSDEDQYGSLEIHCQECGNSYKRTPGKLEERCRLCGGTKGITC